MFHLGVLQLTSGGPEYPPRCVVFSAERVLASLPILVQQPLVTALMSPWVRVVFRWDKDVLLNVCVLIGSTVASCVVQSYSEERWLLWAYAANGGRVGLLKWPSDGQVEIEVRTYTQLNTVGLSFLHSPESTPVH